MAAEAEPSVKNRNAHTPRVFPSPKLIHFKSTKPNFNVFVTILAFTAYTNLAVEASEAIAQGELIEKQKAVRGGWSIEQDGKTGYVVLAENFKA